MQRVAKTWCGIFQLLSCKFYVFSWVTETKSLCDWVKPRWVALRHKIGPDASPFDKMCVRGSPFHKKCFPGVALSQNVCPGGRPLRKCVPQGSPLTKMRPTGVALLKSRRSGMPPPNFIKILCPQKGRASSICILDGSPSMIFHPQWVVRLALLNLLFDALNALILAAWITRSSLNSSIAMAKSSSSSCMRAAHHRRPFPGPRRVGFFGRMGFCGA